MPHLLAMCCVANGGVLPGVRRCGVGLVPAWRRATSDATMDARVKHSRSSSDNPGATRKPAPLSGASDELEAHTCARVHARPG